MKLDCSILYRLHVISLKIQKTDIFLQQNISLALERDQIGKTGFRKLPASQNMQRGLLRNLGSQIPGVRHKNVILG
jgi:hypothetical protein